MTRSPFRTLLAEGSAILGIGFGAWLIHHAFQPASDLPNLALLVLGALDVILCFGLLGYFLRLRLSAGEALPRRWIAGGIVLIAGFVGWIGALFLDSERLLAEEVHHREYAQQLAKLEDSLRHLGDVMAVADVLDRQAWDVNYDQYARVYDQLKASFRTRPTWDQDLTRIDEQIRLMKKAYVALPIENYLDQRLRLRGDFQLARERAVQQAEALRTAVGHGETDVIAHRRARWHGVGAAALTGVVLILGCLLLWLVFDRELRRSWKARARLTDAESRFRTLIEVHSDPLVVLDGAGVIAYANPVWATAFGHQPADLQGASLLEMIHADDRARVRSALQSRATQTPIPCRLSADYGVWHDVEMQLDAHADGSLVARFRNQGETPEFLPTAQIETLPDPEVLKKLEEAQTQIAELERRCDSLRDHEKTARTELEQQRWLLDSHKDAGAEGLLILSAQGQVLSWNPAFAQLWKLSAETMAAHTWLTIAAHMETHARSGWDDFRRASATSHPTDSCWEMTLEDGKLLEVYAQVLRDHPGNVAAVRFHFRDVTRQRGLEKAKDDHVEQTRDLQQRLADHEERKKSHEATVREHEKRVKHLEKQVHERDRQREELDATLLDHQDRLHQMHRAHEGHTAALKANKESMRRLASGVANDFNTVLSVVLGNTDVLRENLPKDHMAQNYVEEIRQAANRGTELSQRLLAFSRNHLLQISPIDLNAQLASLDEKLRATLGHDVQLHWERAEEELWVKTDAHPLEQALLYLTSHVRSHMPDGGTLTITTSRANLSRRELTHGDMQPGSYVQVQLRDTGAGMEDETLTHVFDPYQPVHEGHKGDLSLATAYGTLRQSGGCIDVASTPGEGSTWTILLPETDERPRQERASA